MELKLTEKRQQPRVSFKPDKPLTAQVLLVQEDIAQEDSTPIKVNIINISEAGLCFRFSEKEHTPVKKGVHLILLKIEGEALLQKINDVDMTVLWSTYIKALNSELNGCRFLNLLPDYQIQLRQFIHNLMESKLQSNLKSDPKSDKT
jgi:c-di-GMP-binding flagellar brake protein YcgR